MLLSELINQFADLGNISINHIINDVNIYAVCSIDRPFSEADTDYFQNDTLYVADDSCLWHNKAMPQNIIHIHNDSSCNNQLEVSSNYIQITSDSNVSSIVSQLNYFLIKFNKLQNLKIRMMDIMLHGKGLDGVLDDIGKTLKTSIVIMDIGGKILSYSRPFLIDNPLWLESIEKGYCQPFFMEHLKDMRSKHTGNSLAPIFSNCVDNNLYYLAQRLYSANELFGYVFMLQSDSKFNPICEDTICFIGKTATEYFLRFTDNNDVEASLYTSLFTDILNGISPEQISSRMRIGGINVPSNACIAVLKPRYFRGDNYCKEILVNKLRQVFPETLIVSHNKNAVILFSISKFASSVSPDQLSSLNTICKQEMLVAAISNPFTRATKTKRYYDQASSVLSLAAKLDFEGNVFEYKDFAMLDFIDCQAEDHSIGLHCHPALKILQEYDSENGSQLFDTLRAYIDNGFNQNLTASSLYLHRNTLAYRKQKIVSLTGIDFDNIQTQYNLHFSYVISDYLKKTRV